MDEKDEPVRIRGVNRRRGCYEPGSPRKLGCEGLWSLAVVAAARPAMDLKLSRFQEW